MVTVFTPTYNRAHLLPRLYDSLCQQDCKDFEWLVIDDGSSDGTEDLFQHWISECTGFYIRYQKVQNGGKQRAINKAVTLANGEYFFIVDSDDSLTQDAIGFYIKAFGNLPQDDRFIGVSALRVKIDGSFIRQKPQIEESIGYVDCSNLERSKYNLQSDMAEVFFTEKLRKYPFPVWPGETFTPEAVVWDKMAMDGYILRWFSHPTYYCEYQEGGLTDSTWRLLKNNPMGYAMLFNSNLLHTKSFKERVNLTLQFISCCCLAGEYRYIAQCNSIFGYILFPIGYFLSCRRRKQINMYLS